MKKNVLLTCLSIAAIASVLGVASTNVLANPLVGVDAADTSYPVTADTSATDSATYTDGTFNRTTDLGNTINFEFKYGKHNADGLITLGKNRPGNSPASNFYVGNTSPITSLSALSVSLGGSGDSLLVFVSNDATHYSLVDKLTSSHLSTDKANGYLYVRLANGSQVTDDVRINSLSFTYNCVAADYSDEASDFTNGTTKVVNKATLSYDETNYKNGFQSTKSLKIANTQDVSNGQMDFSIKLGKTYTRAELLNSVLTFDMDSTNNTNFGGSKAYMRLGIYPGLNGNRNNGKAYWITSNLNNGTSWSRMTIDFSTSPADNGALADTDTSFDTIYIRTFYITNGCWINIDQMRLTQKAPNVSEELIAQYEADDMTNNTAVKCYGAATTLQTDKTSIDSVRAASLSLSKDWAAMWYYETADNFWLNDMTGKTISVDLAYDNSTSSTNYPTVVMRLFKDVDGSLLYKNTNVYIGNRSTAGVTKTDLGDGWTRFVVDVDAAWTGNSKDAMDPNNGGDAHHGFGAAYASTFYLDNLKVS